MTLPSNHEDQASHDVNSKNNNNNTKNQNNTGEVDTMKKLRKCISADDILMSLATSTTTETVAEEEAHVDALVNDDEDDDEESVYSAASDWVLNSFFPKSPAAATGKTRTDNTDEVATKALFMLDGNDDISFTGSASSCSVASRYFEPSDFLPKENWENLAVSLPSFAMAIAGAGFALLHPVVFFAGVLTALGTFQAAGATYEYCQSSSDKTSSFFCDNPCGYSHTVVDTEQESSDVLQLPEPQQATKESQQHSRNPPLLSDRAASDALTEAMGEEDDDEEISVDDPMRQVSQITFSEDSALPNKQPKQQQQPAPAATTNANDQNAKNENNNTILDSSASSLSRMDTDLALQYVQDLYPPLPTTALKDVEFHGLNAMEFFNVFFGDNAPYGFEAFHKIRRDKEVRYGSWEELMGVQKPCLLSTAPTITIQQQTKTDDVSDLNQQQQHHSSLSLPPVLERIVEYQAKTNSFLGPPYAKTTKVQRALQISKRLLVLEVKTTLSDIPFSNRFYIIERWIIKSDVVPEDDHTDSKTGGNKKIHKRKHHAHHKQHHKHGGHHHHINSSTSVKNMTSCAYLTITSQVIFTQSCPFEATVIKESAKQISEISNSWNKMAQEGLKRTEETRRLRLLEEEEEQEAQAKNEQEPVKMPLSSAPQKEDTASTSSIPRSDDADEQYEADESIEIQNMGRRRSWVAGDVYSPKAEIEDDVLIEDLKTIKPTPLSLSWKGKSIRHRRHHHHKSTTTRKSISRSLSNLISKNARRRSSSTITTDSTTTKTAPLSPLSLDKSTAASSAAANAAVAVVSAA